MKLEHIQQPGGAAVDLVPSCYALELGDLEVLVIGDGILVLPTATMSTRIAGLNGSETRRRVSHVRFLA